MSGILFNIKYFRHGMMKTAVTGTHTYRLLVYGLLCGDVQGERSNATTNRQSTATKL